MRACNCAISYRRTGPAAGSSRAAKCSATTAAGFSAEYPGVEIRLRDVVAQRIEDLVRSGSVDFGLGVQARASSGLAFKPLMVDQLCLLLPVGHPLNDGRPLALADLDG